MRSDDEALVTRCLEGDQPAFAFLVSKYKEVVHAYAYRKVGDYQQAEDIAQEVFIKAYRKLAQLKWPHRFQSWLYAITSNECKLWLRNRSKEREQEVSWEDVPSEKLDELAVRSHNDEDIELTVKSAMETLPDDRQLVLSLFYMSSMSIKEIAHFMGVSPNSIGIKLHRARKQLGKRVEEMIGKQLRKEKLKSGFVFKVVDSIRDMPIPSLPKPRPIRWAPIPISIGLALLIGIIGYGLSSGRDVSPDVPTLKPAETTFEVSLLPDPNRQTILDAEPENASNLVVTDVGYPEQTQPTAGTRSSGIVAHRVWENAGDTGAVSPDGKYVSYVNWDNGNLGIHDFETGENREITDEGNWETWEYIDSATWTTWSPDSKQIAYIWYKGSGIRDSDASLRIVGIDGAKPRVLCTSSFSSLAELDLPFPRAWSRDGKYILAPRSHCIMLVSVADGSIRGLESPHGRHGYFPSLSPDGLYVTYDSPQSGDSSKRDIFLLATDGSHQMALVEHPADDFAPFWTPDGNRIVFASDRSGSTGIWVLEVVDGKLKGSAQLVSDNLDGMTPKGLTQDGSYYYGLQGRTNDIYFADLDPETGKVVKPPYKAVQTFEGLNKEPDFSPDGKRLVYLSLRKPGGWRRSSSFVIRALETGEERELKPDLPLSLPSSSAPRWFPDGRSILVNAKVTYSAKDERWGLHQINVGTGAVTPVVWHDKHDKWGAITPAPPVWSPDGSKIFFKRKWEGGNDIRAYDFETKREWKPDFQLACGEGYPAGLALSPDGQHLAFMVSCDDEWSLQIAPSSGGDTRETARLRKEEAYWGWGLTWTPDGRYLLYSRLKDEANGLCELCRVPVEGGEPQNLGLTMKLYTHLSVHPDGSRIAFTGPGPRPGNEIWAIENFLSTSTAAR